MDALTLVAMFVSFLIGITVHEAAHAWMGYKLGDPTAKELGRISLNPLRHIDLIGTILLPLIGLVSTQSFFGWAKPTPFDPDNFEEPMKDELLVAFAGPFANLLLAVITAALIYVMIFVVRVTGLHHTWPDGFAALIGCLYVLVVENLTLAFFNLIPIPPLDGSTVIKALLPRKYAQDFNYINRWGFFILIFAYRSPLGDYLSLYMNNCIDYCLKLVGLYIP